MHKQIRNIIFLLCLLLTSCNTVSGAQPSPSPTVTKEIQKVEVTRIVVQTQVVTEIVPFEVTPTQPPPKLANVDTSQCGTSSLWDGSITIVQYFTYIDKGLYEDAYALRSVKRKREQTLEDFKLASNWYRPIKIHYVSPVDRCNGANYSYPNFFIVVFEPGGADPRLYPKGQAVTFFITLVQEDDQWKIDDIGTGP